MIDLNSAPLRSCVRPAGFDRRRAAYRDGFLAGSLATAGMTVFLALLLRLLS